MDNVSVFLSLLMLVSMIVLFAPGILARNRGNILRNIALWLAIFTALALVYRLFGPGSPNPLFSGPAVVMHREASQTQKPSEPPAKPDGSHGFTPPSE